MTTLLIVFSLLLKENTVHVKDTCMLFPLYYTYFYNEIYKIQICVSCPHSPSYIYIYIPVWTYSVLYFFSCLWQQHKLFGHELLMTILWVTVHIADNVPYPVYLLPYCTSKSQMNLGNKIISKQLCVKAIVLSAIIFMMEHTYTCNPIFALLVLMCR